MEEEPIAPILVATFGNERASDDAFAVLVSRLLEKISLPGVELLHCCQKPGTLISHLVNRRALCIVASARHPELPAGRLITMDFFDQARLELVCQTCPFGSGVLISKELEASRSLGHLPKEIRLVGITVGSTELDRPVCSEILSRVPIAALCVARWADSRYPNPNIEALSRSLVSGPDDPSCS